MGLEIVVFQIHAHNRVIAEFSVSIPLLILVVFRDLALLIGLDWTIES